MAGSYQLAYIIGKVFLAGSIVYMVTSVTYTSMPVGAYPQLSQVRERLT